MNKNLNINQEALSSQELDSFSEGKKQSLKSCLCVLIAGNIKEEVTGNYGLATGFGWFCGGFSGFSVFVLIFYRLNIKIEWAVGVHF